jgi:hypothetical protein
MEPSMHPPVMTGFLVIFAVSGCASMKAPSPGAERDVAPAAVPPAAAAQPVAPPTPPAQPVAPPTAAPPSEPEPANNGSDQSSAPADAAAAAPSSVNPAKRSSPAKTTSTPGTRPAKQTGAAAAQSRPSIAPTAPAAAAAPSPSSVPAPTPIPATASSPTLNLADLEQRLRETRAIGVFTKLSLKNQVDDLLNAFRTLYRGPDKHPPAELRQRYDMLLMKVLSLLQDGDPPLASEIASSREAIWSILADPEKFATI